ncbi:MAG: hypothetical protein GX300_01925 [Tissierellia bacterium]|nr:hypothetical protein [Tissierellia bacterium]
MKPMSLKNKISWGTISLGLFAIIYCLCRFAFFDVHRMKQWPNLLAVLGLIIIVIASIRGRRILSITTISGYLAGFILGMVLNTDGIDPGGGRTNNAWIIWGSVFIISVVIGFLLERKFNNK